MKLKITGKLTAYFALALSLFALVMGLLFSIMFRDYTLRLNMGNLEARAEQIAASLSSYGRGMVRGGGNMNSAMRLLSEAEGTDIWLVDSAGKLVSLGRMQSNPGYGPLPEGSRALLDEVFQGKTVRSQAFSSLLNQPTITVATPVLDARGGVSLALLLHSAVEGADKGVLEGLKLMGYAALIGLVLAALAAALFARSFIRPIKAMQVAANHMAEGDYLPLVPVSRRDELGALSGDLNRLAESLRAAEADQKLDEKQRRDFVANVSHELRTPVTVLLSSLEAIRDGLVRDPEELDRYHQAMLGETRHLKRMISDLLDLSRLQSPDYRIHKEPLALFDLLTDAGRSAELLGEGKSLHISVAAAPGLQLSGDPTRIRQALMILLDNAVRFSPIGGNIRLSAGATPQGLSIEVADEGPGIPEQALPYIFGRFFTHDTSGGDKGTGLGLAIAKEITDRHGALLSAANRPEGGAVFTMLFPG
jgi:signal transduction histidine kinase